MVVHGEVILVVNLGEIWDNNKVEVQYLMELAAAAAVAADRDDGDEVVEAASNRHGGGSVVRPQGCMEVAVRVVDESSKGNSYLNNINC